MKKNEIICIVFIWIISFIITTIVIAYKIINRPIFQQIHLEKIGECYWELEYTESSKYPIGPYWNTIEISEGYERFQKKENMSLPMVNFEKEMIVLAYGSEFESFDYDLNEPSFKMRGRYIGYEYFKRIISEPKIYIYKTDKIPLMNAEEGCFSPEYKGRGRPTQKLHPSWELERDTGDVRLSNN